MGSVGVYGEGEACVSGDADLGGLGYASDGWGTDMGPGLWVGGHARLEMGSRLCIGIC